MTPADPSDVLTGGPYRGYVYAYPHKTAYRRLDPAVPLKSLWRNELRQNLFLYVHVPFCTMRCGFCNLFTVPRPDDDLVPLYLDALRAQAEAVRECLPDATFVRLAVGGGTPTFLDEGGLEELFDVVVGVMGADLGRMPVGIEASPDTVTPAKVAVLKGRGVGRVSVGVQSFVDAETRASGRPQDPAGLAAALGLLTAADFPTLNVDLIYGLPHQTVETWLSSVRAAVGYRPEEVYLYPLYVRPLTGLGKSKRRWDDLRLACYREGRDLLLGEGYRQVSMRMFRRADVSGAAGPAYCCQGDGMVGLGVGARSYTAGVHYSTEYAVGAAGVRGILADYVARDRHTYQAADHGFVLDEDEQRRRYLLQSLLHAGGLDGDAYRRRFGADPADHFPDLRAFAGLGLLAAGGGRWAPTPLGLERSDALGPWFFSARVRHLMGGYEPR